MDSATKAPAVVSTTLQEAFEAKARGLGLNPSDPWIGGYVDYEWHHLRYIVEALPDQLDGMKILEFGCNVGASAILFSALGAKVTAVDISRDLVDLARLNAGRYGFDNIDFKCVADTRQLPFEDHAFQMVSCNSVLEYVAPTALSTVQQEMDRVLAPGGLILVTGTSNRLAPREVHSGRLLINYVPRSLDTVLGGNHQRGIWPWRARSGFGDCYDNLDHAGNDGLFARSRRAMGMAKSRLASLLVAGKILGVSPGLLSPNIFCVLRKRSTS